MTEDRIREIVRDELARHEVKLAVSVQPAGDGMEIVQEMTGTIVPRQAEAVPA